MSEVKLYLTNTTSEIANRVLNSNVKYELPMIWQRKFQPFVPELEGNLMRVTHIEPYKVIYDSPYAHYQWEGKLYVDPITKKGAFFSPDYGYWSRPNVKKEPTDIPLQYTKLTATPHWEQSAYDVFKADVADELTKYIRRM